ncbi:MAG: hypothetical protein ACJAS1_005084 [Oleiphilaceae bacterium]|jgi:hypothetical protein
MCPSFLYSLEDFLKVTTNLLYILFYHAYFIMPILSKPKTRALTLVAEFKASKFESPAVTKSSNSVINDFPGIIAKLPESVPAIIGTFV